MKKEMEISQNVEAKLLLLLFLFLTSLYLLLTPGYPSTSMGGTTLSTARSIIEEGDFSLEKPTLETGIGKDGSYYTYIGLAFVLVTTLFAVISKWIGMFPYGFYFTNQILTPVCCLLLFLVGRELKYSLKTSVSLSLIYGLGTMALVHSRYVMPEPLTTVVYLTAFLFLLKYWRRRKVKWLLLCGGFTGLSLIVRPEAPLFIVGIVVGVLLLFYGNYRTGKRDVWGIAKETCVFFGPIIIFFAVSAFYNYMRFGNILEFGYSTKDLDVIEIGGYGSQGMQERIVGTLLGFAGMWVIPCRSMFFINPVLVFVFWAVKDFWRKYRFASIIIGIVFVLHVLLYSSRGPIGFSGSGAWGIRYMVPMASFIVVIMGVFIDKIIFHREQKRFLRICVLVFILSMTIQFIGASMNYQPIQHQAEEEYGEYDARFELNMNPKWNLILHNLKWLRKGIVDCMYYNYLKPGTTGYTKHLWRNGFPPWVGVSCFFLILTLGTSGYFLYRQIVFLDVAQSKGKKIRKKKRK